MYNNVYNYDDNNNKSFKTNYKICCKIFQIGTYYNILYTKLTVNRFLIIRFQQLTLLSQFYVFETNLPYLRKPKLK